MMLLLFDTARLRIFRRRKNSKSTSLSKATRNELNRLIHTSDPIVRKVCRFTCAPASRTQSTLLSNDTTAPFLCFISQTFDAEMQAFFKLHSRYLSEEDSQRDLCVSLIFACRRYSSL